MYSLHYKSPLGKLSLIGDEEALWAIYFGMREESTEKNSTPLLEEAKKQLDEYFAGKRQVFTLPLHMNQGTLFQQKVWRMLQEIPYGTTCSYGTLAQQLERPGASRAVGSALGKNPLPIVLPCHRVIRSDGHLGGYSGGSTYKEALLNIEKVNRQK